MSALLDKLLEMQKSHKDKKGLIFFSECSNQNDKRKAKEKVEAKKKPEDPTKVRNPEPVANRPLVRQANAQRYSSFNSYCFQCNCFGHKL